MTQPLPLSALFLPHLAPLVREALSTWPELEAELATLQVRAEKAWPEIDQPAARYLPYLAQRVPEEGDPRQGLRELRAEDLALACACLTGEPRALARFESHYFREINAALGRLDVSAAAIDEVKQLLRAELFVAAPERRPKIAEYSGRGDLRVWMRVTATRAALKLIRKERKEVLVEEDQLPDLPAAEDDLELYHMKQTYRTAFKEAMHEAFARLPPKDKTLLQHHFLDGLSIDELGALGRVHRATAARWLAKAKGQLLAETRRGLMQRIRLSHAECDSILALIRSQMAITMTRLFGRKPSPPPSL